MIATVVMTVSFTRGQLTLNPKTKTKLRDNVQSGKRVYLKMIKRWTTMKASNDTTWWNFLLIMFVNSNIWRQYTDIVNLPIM